MGRKSGASVPGIVGSSRGLLTGEGSSRVWLCCEGSARWGSPRPPGPAVIHPSSIIHPFIPHTTHHCGECWGPRHEQGRQGPSSTPACDLSCDAPSPLGFPGGSVVKNLPAMQETWVRSLGWEDPLEEEMATHSSILAWRIPWTEESGSPRGHKESNMTEHARTYPPH